MQEEKSLKSALWGNLLGYVRSTFPEEIEEAYEFFWEEEYPEEFLDGLPLELGFINFEDWMLCDYRNPENRQGFIDRFIEEKSGELGEPELALLETMRRSRLSVYEVVETEPELVLEDLLCGGKTTIVKESAPEGLEVGNVFGARLFDPGNEEGGAILSGCAYPFGPMLKDHVIDTLNRQLDRYKNPIREDAEPDLTMETFLKRHGELVNMVWVSNLYRRRGTQG